MSVSKVLYKSFYWKLLQFVLSFLTTVVLARILKPEISAAFYSLLYTFSLIAVFFSMGLDISLNYFISKKELSVPNANTIIALVTIVALVIFLPVIYFFYHPAFSVNFDKKELVLLGGLQIVAVLLTTLSGSIFTAYRQNHLAAKISVFFSVLFLVLVSLLKFGTDIFSIKTGIFYSWYIVSFLLGVFLFLYSNYRYNKSGSFYSWSVAPIKKIIRFSFITFLINFVFYASAKLPVFLLPYWVDANAIGNYIQAYKLLEYIFAIVSFIYFPLVAMTTVEENEKMKLVILLLIRVFNTLAVLLSFIAVLYGRIIFSFIFGPAFGAMYGVFICLIPALIASCSSPFFTAYFFGKGYLKYNLFSASSFLISLLILFFPLTQYYGIKGAAFALSGASVCSLLVDIYIFRKIHRFRISEILFINRKDINNLRTIIIQ